jgi:MerR family copper efflux transcriptional regulator
MEAALQIAEVARRSGFAPTTLRYYEEIGLVTPTSRTPAGYRLYDEATLERLAFIGRAKQLGCSLDEIADLVAAWDGGRCAPVQEHLRTLLETKISAAQAQVAELLGFTSQLQHVRSGLDGHTPDGPCDDQCGCVQSSDEVAAVAVALTPGRTDSQPIACTLDGAAMSSRLEDWQSLLARVTSSTAIAEGVRLTFEAGVPIGDIAELARAEQACCPFFSFAVTVDERGTALEVTAPDEARSIVDGLFGVPAHS